MTRVCLIGPSNIDYHFKTLLGMNDENINYYKEQLVKQLAENEAELVLLPDQGISLEIAKSFRTHSGMPILATVPESDKDFGIDNLKPHLAEEVTGRKVFTQTINTKNWYKQDLQICLFGDITLCLGYSPGTMGELTYGIFLANLFKKKELSLEVLRSNFHPEIRITENFPFTVVVFLPFAKDRLPFEIEKYIEDNGGTIKYITEPQELGILLGELDAQIANR